MIVIKNDRRVSPSNYKIANQFENKTGTIDFDLSCLNYEGNKYLICKYQGDNDFKKPLLLDENNSVPVLTFLSAKSGVYQCVLVISSAAIDENYDFSTDNPLFVSNVFSIYVDENFLTGTSTAWDLPPAMQNKFDELIALIDKVNEDLESGAFDGNGIENIKKISSIDGIDTYKINFTDGSYFDYQVSNGKDGQMPTITIQNGNWYVNGVDTGQKSQGERGIDGVGIENIEKTSSNQNIDSYTINYTDGSTSTFTVTNGLNGKDGTDGITPNIQIGTVTTLEPNQQATVERTGTDAEPVFNFGIPKGEKGDNTSDNILIGTVPKQENPSIDDGWEAPLRDLVLYGKSTQVHTNGKNLLNINDMLENTDLNTNDGSVYTRSGVCTTQFIFLKSGTYMLSRSDNSYMWKMVKYDSDKNYLQYAFTNLNPSTKFTMESDGYVRINSSATKENIELSNQMLEIGSEVTSYEPYTGGQPSPSQEYPQEIINIDKVNLSICGKNLFDVDYAKNIDNWNKEQDKSYYNLKGFYLKPNTTYTISMSENNMKKGYNDSYIFACYIGNKIGEVNGEMIGNTNNDIVKNVKTFTTNDKPYYFNLYMYRMNNNDALKIVFDELLPNFQIEENQSATKYEPFKLQTLSLTPPKPLYSTLDGSIADEVDVDKGVYRYNLKKTTFDKTQMSNVKYQTATTSGYSVFVFNLSQDLISDRKVNSAVLCNILQGLNKGMGAWYTDKLNVISGDFASKNVFYANVSSDIATPEQFLALFENNVEFGFALETPIEIPIPPEDLEKLKSLKNYTGVTNILCNAPVSFNYEQSLQIVINKLINKVGSNTISVKELESEVINNV